jgi:hypothetical protein
MTTMLKLFIFWYVISIIGVYNYLWNPYELRTIKGSIGRAMIGAVPVAFILAMLTELLAITVFR